jgi:tRNA-2-methylthio-N6-dimethylallyladenosine synthase
MDKTFIIETFGCQMNKSDSELMFHSLVQNGFTPSESDLSADLIVFNTCSVRAHAENRAISRIKSARASMSARGGIIAVTGCMAQRIGKDLLAEGTADIVIGPYQSPEIGKIISEYLVRKHGNAYLSLERKDYHDRINPEIAREKDDLPWHKWVSITHGCDNYCSYCIVPYVRGKMISSPSGSIIEYVRSLADNGITEVSLLGQNVNQYGKDSGDIPFHKLLEEISGISGLLRINFLTSHPMDFTGDIIRVIRDNENISRSIHLPLQSGSDRILSLMNRKYTMKRYYEIADEIGRLLSAHSISTDLIVGFPGETADEFSETLSAVEKIRFDEAYTYAYSPREGTTAGSMPEIITRDEKIARLGELISVQREISRQKLSARINHTDEMIVERISRKSGKEVMGKTFLNHPAVLQGNADDIGKKIRIQILALRGSTLYGEKIA